LLVHHKTLHDHVKKPVIQNDVVELGAVKMFYDGTTGSKTALMSTPYVDQSFGMRIMDQDVFKHQVRLARDAQMPVAVHVIGDQGLFEVAKILKQIPVKKGLYDRVIHASYANQEAIVLLKTLDVFLDIQPQFLTTDFPHTFALFETTPNMVFPFKTYHDENILYGYSSDAPVEDPNPLLGIYAAISRDIGYTFQESQKMTRYHAIKAYTTHAWILSKHQGGYFKKEYPAHFVVFKKDLFSIEEIEFKTLEVSQTWMLGKNIYQAP
jgi:predicted amidohydrolase YtcJ